MRGNSRGGEGEERGTVGRHNVSQVITVSKAQQQGQTNKPKEEEEKMKIM